MIRRAVLLAALVLASFACSDDGNVVTIETGLDPEVASEIDTQVLDDLDPEVLDQLDTDNDGVVSRERAERDARRVAQELAYQALLSDGTAVAASFPGGQVLVGDVLANIVESPVTLMDDPENPTHEEYVSRLTSMIQLRLAGVALDALGFRVDITLSDAEINGQVQAHLEGPFEEFAQQRAIEEDPSIERLATPHCVSALAVTSEADAIAAAGRVQGGEPLSDVAAAVNLPGLTGLDGTLGCDQPFDLFGGGELALALLDLEPSELTEPLLLPSAASPTGELWVVLHLDALRTDAIDLSSIGPFAGHVLTEIMSSYEVDVAPELGAWIVGNLRVSMPLLP